jgi:L-histidine N-alpha-methyltransferase
VSIRGLGIEVELRDGEEIRTEISCKFTRATIEAAYEQSGLRLVEFWTDPDEQFGLSLARPG